jgi:hypothetical protein
MRHRKVLLMVMLIVALFTMSMRLLLKKSPHDFVGLGTGTAPNRPVAEALAERFNAEQ